MHKKLALICKMLKNLSLWFFHLNNLELLFFFFIYPCFIYKHGEHISTCERPPGPRPKQNIPLVTEITESNFDKPKVTMK